MGVESLNEKNKVTGFSDDTFERNFLKEVPKLTNLKEKYLKDQEEDPYGFKLASRNNN